MEVVGRANVQMDLHRDGGRGAPPVDELKTAEAELMADSAAAYEPSEGGEAWGVRPPIAEPPPVGPPIVATAAALDSKATDAGCTPIDVGDEERQEYEDSYSDLGQPGCSADDSTLEESEEDIDAENVGASVDGGTQGDHGHQPSPRSRGGAPNRL